VSRIAAGGVIAAGEGSRLRALSAPKPLVEVAGRPLIEHVLSNFVAAGISPIAVIFNSSEEDCAGFVRRRFGSKVSKIVVRSTASSLESFREILDVAGPGRLLVSTVDAICARGDFVDFVRRAEAAPDDAVVLGVTDFVDDEKPLWVQTAGGGGDESIASIGGSSGDAVTAGLYVVPERLRDAPIPAALPRLRDYLRWLSEAGEPLFGIRIARVVDVDRPEDLAAAERLAESPAETA